MMMPTISLHSVLRHGLVVVALMASASSVQAWEPGSGSGGSTDSIDRADRAAQKAAEDAAKVQDRATRDAARYAEERTKIMADAEKDPVKAAEDLAKLDADAAKWEADRAEETAKIEADLAEEEAKIREDAAEEAAEDASHSADDNVGSSKAMEDVGLSENPDRDRRGFPVRRGEVVALDLSETALTQAKALGFGVIELVPLEQLGSSIVRLSVPEGKNSDSAIADIRRLDPQATVDFTHYYGMQPAGERSEAGDGRARLGRKRGSLSIGMVDTAVAGHAFFKGARIEQRGFGAGAGAGAEHGTAVASLLVSEGTDRLAVADIFRGGPGSAPFTSADAVARGLEWMSERHMPVINMSLAGPRNAILDTMILRAIRKGAVVVASAGNGGPSAPPAYPAALPQVIAVTAVDHRDRIYRYANQGPYITVAARGVHEPAAASAGGFGYFSGTSFATPHVAAWMARCLDKTRRQAVDARRCTDQLIASARDLGAPGRDPVYGHGVVR